MERTVVPLMDPAAVSHYLGVPITTLYRWRVSGKGPRAIKTGKHLRWRPDDVEAWLEEQADAVDPR